MGFKYFQNIHFECIFVEGWCRLVTICMLRKMTILVGSSQSSLHSVSYGWFLVVFLFCKTEIWRYTFNTMMEQGDWFVSRYSQHVYIVRLLIIIIIISNALEIELICSIPQSPGLEMEHTRVSGVFGEANFKFFVVQSSIDRFGVVVEVVRVGKRKDISVFPSSDPFTDTYISRNI